MAATKAMVGWGGIVASAHPWKMISCHRGAQTPKARGVRRTTEVRLGVSECPRDIDVAKVNLLVPIGDFAQQPRRGLVG
jgi:hypothetical protein